MPQLDIMTFYIQGLSVFLSVFLSFLFFYIYFLPSISLSLFSRFLLKKKFNIDKRILKINVSHIRNKIIIINAYFLICINQHLANFYNSLIESLRFKKEALYTSFFDEHIEELQTLLHNNTL